MVSGRMLYVGWMTCLVIAMVAFAIFFGEGSIENKPAALAEVKQREVSVMSTLRISESETVKLLTVPDAMLSDPLFDTRCLIYTNQEFRQTQIKCLTRPGGPE